MLERLGRRSHRRRWWVLGAWIVVAVTLASLGRSLGGEPRDAFSIPHTDSQAANDVLQSKYPSANLPTATVVFHTASGTVQDAETAAAIEQSIAAARALPRVRSVTDPLDPTASLRSATAADPELYAALAPLVLPTLSPDGAIATSTVTYNEPLADLSKHRDTYGELSAAFTPARAAGVHVDFGGSVVDLMNPAVRNAGDSADKIGILIAIVILLLAFGSVIAMGLPIGTALLGLGVGLSALTVLEARFAIGTVAPALGTMIGLGVGIDYSLFLVTRFRESLAAGMDVPDAVARAMGTAGSAVLFAGITVCMATSGLVIAGVPYVSTMGFTAALVVAIMILAALTLLPALLGIVGTGIDRFRLPGRRRRERADDGRRHGWARWAHEVARRPWMCAISSLVVLLVLAIPLLSIRLGWTSDGNEPKALTQRRAYDLVTKGLGPGTNGPLLTTVPLPHGNQAGAISRLSSVVKQLQATPGVAHVGPPAPAPGGGVAVLEVIPTSGPNSSSTQALVRRMRTELPRGSHVGGQTAELIDLIGRIDARLPLFIAAVVAGAFVLLMMVFRSVLVPLKAAVMNLLSIGAAYGVVVAMFQWGWGQSLIGLDQRLPIVAVVPLMMFAILFGLSMDYEVFLLSRIREEYLATGDNRDSVSDGLTETARVITSAALIMISVFLSFVTNDQPVVKMIGVGLAVAVLVDATLVRMVLVPATMELLGDANWWIPGWLDRLLPRITVDSGGRRPDAAAESPRRDAVPTPVHAGSR